MKLKPFDGARFKVKRAQKHIADLRKCLADFGERMDVMIAPVGKLGHLTEYAIVFSEPPPEEIPFIIGDAIHNLRSALDYMICDIARIRLGDSKKMKFPFGKDEAGLDAAIAKDKLIRLGEEVVAAIKALRPYKENGYAPLRGLHDLDIDDKHEAVLPTYVAAQMRPNVSDLGIVLNGFMRMPEGSRVRLSEGDDAASSVHRLPGDPEPLFPEGMPFEGEPVTRVLDYLAKMVTEIVENFASRFGPTE